MKSDFNRRAAPDFEAALLRNQQSRRELRQGATPSRGRAIRRCRKQGVPPMMGPHNVTSSSGPGASHRENFRGPTLIKVKSVKSDFDRRAAADFEAAFLRNQQSRRESRPGRTPSKMRAIRRCRKQGVPPMMGRLNSGTSWGLGPLIEKIFRGQTLIKVKSVKSDFDQRAAADFEAAFFRHQQSGRKGRRGATPS